MSYINYKQKSTNAAIWRNAVLEVLGNKCKMCGFTDKRALQIDHVHGGGSAETRIFGTGVDYYRQMFQHIEDYQILCANCNWIKRAENQEVSHGKIRRFKKHE